MGGDARALNAGETWRELGDGFTAAVDGDVMDHELFDSAACAASDLTARLAADLSVASARLLAAEANCRATTAGGPPGLAMRRERLAWRRQVAGLRQLLAGMPYDTEVAHAATA